MREIVVTRDGSHTVAIPERKVMYHSVHGAIQESVHVYIKAGLWYVSGHVEPPDSIPIFEMGLGTGLNAFLTAIEAAEKKINIHYTTVEAFPLTADEAAVLNYAETLGHAALFQQLHECPWNEEVRLSDFFTITKQQADLINYSTGQQFHLIYYDAFAPSAQPELWTKEVFEKLYHMMESSGVLVTYCSKGDVRRAMVAAGFEVERIPGPKWKREMLRATSPPTPLQQSWRGEMKSVVEEPFPKYKVENTIQYENARENRKDSTEAEAKLWEQIRDNKLGCKFRRQHPIENFKVDFACLQKGLVVEVDGGYHNTPEQKQQDDQRTAILEQKGFTVLRFSNEEVLQNVYAVCDKIKKLLPPKTN